MIFFIANKVSTIKTYSKNMGITIQKFDNDIMPEEFDKDAQANFIQDVKEITGNFYCTNMMYFDCIPLANIRIINSNTTCILPTQSEEFMRLYEFMYAGEIFLNHDIDHLLDKN